MTLDLHAAYRGECPTDSREYNSQIVIDFRRGSHGRARIFHIDLLLYRDSGRDSLDGLDIRFGHPSEELARVRRQAFGETPLPLGE